MTTPLPHLKLLLAAFLACAVALRAESRFFVSTAGSLLEAEIIAVAGENITLRKVDDAREITVGRSTLCKVDHAYIDAWAAANPGMVKADASTTPAAASTAAGPKKFGFTVTVRSKKSTRGFADGGTRYIDISYGFSIQSREIKREITGAKATLLTFAKEANPTDGDHLYVMQRMEQEVNLRPQAKIEGATPEAGLSYYQYSSYRDGAKEYGYMMIITDSAGEIQHLECNPSTLDKFAKEALALKAPCVVSREFRVINTNFSSDITITTP